MSIAATVAVYRAHIDNPRAKLLLIALADYADDELEVAPVPDKGVLCEFVGCSMEQLKSAMSWLYERKILQGGSGDDGVFRAQIVLPEAAQ